MAERCSWCLGDPDYVDYHDHEWGRPTYDEHTLFEFLILEGAQAGLSWLTILRKRAHYREAFAGFDPVRIAAFSKKDVSRLLTNEGIVRNRAKVEGAIANARAWLELESPADYLWSFVDGKQIRHRFRSLSEVPAHTEQSATMSKALKKLGFKFVGPTICYAFMQATGMVNDHLLTCPVYKACLEKR